MKTSAGIVPIDLQMAVFTQQQAQEAGLLDLKISKVISANLLAFPG
jgi:hypothetical protein